MIFRNKLKQLKIFLIFMCSPWAFGADTSSHKLSPRDHALATPTSDSNSKPKVLILCMFQKYDFFLRPNCTYTRDKLVACGFNPEVIGSDTELKEWKKKNKGMPFPEATPVFIMGDGS